MNKIGLPSILVVVCVGLFVVQKLAVSQPILQGTPNPVQMSSLIAFMSDRSKNTEIYIMRPDGSNPIRLTENSRYDTAPIWLSDTGTILFSAVRDEHERQVLPHIIGIGSLNEQLFPPIAALLEQEFYDVSQIFPSPDGSRFAFVSMKRGNNEIYIMNGDDSEPINITNDMADDDEPTWSPDGKHLAFTSNRNGNSEIYTMDVDGTNLKNLTNAQAADFTPAWSPDSKSIAFGSNRDGNSRIYVMNADGSNVVPLTVNDAGNWHPGWSPDSSQIVFSTDRDGNIRNGC